MNQILLDYTKRFLPKDYHKFQDQFFTNHSLNSYKTDLPYLFGIEIFCIRLLKAFLNKEQICIYSDYDTDAVTATGTMYWGLNDLGYDKDLISFYAPDRFTEGYGMNLKAVKELSKTNDLIISVDCGINSVDEARAVLEYKGSDLIITDHHHLTDQIPKAVSVINPRLSENYLSQKSLNSELTNKTKDYLDDLELDEKIKQRTKNWLVNMLDIQEKRKHFVSTSTTGVGVAWFSLVWLGYFLEEIQV